MTPVQSNHASLAGAFPAEPPAPPAEEQDTGARLAEARQAVLQEGVDSIHPPTVPDYDRTFGGWLDDDGFEPDWHEDPNAAEIEHALRAAAALLTRQIDSCADLGLLPAGYSPDEACDFEEFFTPEAALLAALAAPEWGCLDDTEGREIARHLAAAVDATAAELARVFDHQLPLSARLRFRLMKACRAELTLLHAELFAAAGKVVA